MKPLRGKYLIEIIPDHRRLPSGLFLAETIKETPHAGKILSCGDPGSDSKGRKVNSSCVYGDIVHFKQQWSSFVDKDRVIVREEDIVAIERI